MTVVAAMIFGLLSGLFVRGVRRAVLTSVVPWLAILGLQTWLLASGHGNNPASTTKEVGYWVVQVIALAFCAGLAAVVASIRARRGSTARQTTASMR